MSFSDRIKAFTVEDESLETMLELSVVADLLLTKYEQVKVTPPDWLADGAVSIDRAIKSNLADSRAKRKKEIEARLETLQTTEEKRAKLRKELEELEAAG